MSKSPQGVYVNEATHNRVSMLVENALDGHGTLAGFIAYAEEALSAATSDENLLDSQRWQGQEAALKRMQDREQMNRFDAAPKDGFGASPVDRSAVLEAAKSNLARYEEAWQALGKAMPWGEGDPRSHIVALYLLSGDSRLWQYDSAYDSPRVRHDTLYSELDDLLLMRYPIPFPNEDSVGQEAPQPTLLWRGNSLEALLEPAKNRSTSFYLDPEAHDLTIKVFGRDFFNRIERGLRRLLDTRHHLALPNVTFKVLEHGPALFDYWWQDVKPNVREAALKTQLEQMIGDVYEDDLTHPYEDLIERADWAGRTAAIFQLLWDRYRIQPLGPERSLAYQVIRCDPLPSDRTFVTNAVDYHLLELFQAYALSVLPLEQREERRVHPMTLATLAQPSLFPTKTTLEAYGNAKAVRDLTGSWELRGGRGKTLELSDAEAYWTAQVLNTVLSTQPTTTQTSKLAAILERLQKWDGSVPAVYDFKRQWARTVLEHGKATRVKLPLGIDVIARVLDAVRDAGEHPDPVAIGLKFAAQLTDEALKTNGKVSEAFLRRAGFYLDEVSA